MAIGATSWNSVINEKSLTFPLVGQRLRQARPVRGFFEGRKRGLMSDAVGCRKECSDLFPGRLNLAHIFEEPGQIQLWSQDLDEGRVVVTGDHGGRKVALPLQQKAAGPDSRVFKTIGGVINQNRADRGGGI